MPHPALPGLGLAVRLVIEPAAPETSIVAERLRLVSCFSPLKSCVVSVLVESERSPLCELMMPALSVVVLPTCTSILPVEIRPDCSLIQLVDPWPVPNEGEIEAVLNQELGEPFRRDAMKKPVQVAGISKVDMQAQ